MSADQLTGECSAAGRPEGAPADPSRSLVSGFARPLRVVWLLNDLARGGAEQLLLEIKDPISQCVDFMPVTVAEDPGSLDDGYRAVGLRPISLKSGGRLDPQWIARFRRLIKTLRPDVIHLHLPYPAVGGRLASVGLHLPIVYTEHSLKKGHHPITRWANALTYWRNDAVIAVSDAVADDIRASPWGRALRHRLFVIPNGIDIEGVRRQVAGGEEITGIGRGPAYGVVGHLRKRKGVDVLLRASTLLAREVPEARGYVVGSGEDAAALGALKDRLGSGTVHFLGIRTDARAIMGRLDVFVVPSRVEGLPLALLEAMALGRPIVATRVGGIPSVLEHEVNGLLVPPDEPAALAAAIARLLRNPAWGRALGERARQTVEHRYSNRQTARRYLDVYRTVLTRQRAFEVRKLGM